MSSELDDADRCTLVRLYRTHKVLWDKNHCDFTNSKTRSKAIEKIVAAANIPDLTKAKATLFFRNMRREFYFKLTQGQLTQSYLQTTKWKWLKIANQFLTIDNQPKKPHTNGLTRDNSEHLKNIELIGFYKQEELLWNTNLPQYKIRAMREAAWHRIVDKMDIQGLTPDDVRIKIKNLRTVYHKHYRQGCQDSFAGSPPWMPVMDEFLRPILFDGDTSSVKATTKPLDFDDDELNLAIMECYRQQTVLWHPLEPYFGNRTVTDQAWDECVERMGSRAITRKDFQRLLKSLVARYSRKRSKIHADDVAAYCPNLKWFHLAESFLGPIMFRQGDGQSVEDEENNEDENSVDSYNQQEETQAVPPSLETVEEVVYEPESIELPHDEDQYRSILIGEEYFPRLDNHDRTYDTNLVSETVEICGEMLAANQPEPTETSLCRACFRSSAKNRLLNDIHREYLGYRTDDEESRLPNSICDACEKIILDFRDFRSACQANEETYLAKLQANELVQLEKTLPDGEIIELNIETDVDYDLDDLNFEDDGSLVIEEYLVEPPATPVDDSSAIVDPRPLLFKCDQCSKAYDKLEHLQSHLKLIHNLKPSRQSEKEVLLLPCTLCKSMFRKRLSLASHMKYVHNKLGGKTKAVDERKVKPKLPLNPSARSRTVCQICGESRTARSMKVHLASHRSGGERFQCHLCEKNYKMPDALRSHIKTKHLGKTYDCQYCDQKFTSWNGRSLHTHLKHYNPKAKWSCEYCDRMFPSEMTLRRHCRIIHTGATRTYSCDQCDTVCSNPSILKEHKKAKHSDDQHTCHQCGKVFSRIKFLRAHAMMMHTNEKNYNCPVCHRKFKLNAFVRSHVARVHPNYRLPPKGSILNAKALQRIERQRQVDDSLVKVDFDG